MKDGKRCTAVILAAGTGSRMRSGVAKQYMPLAGKPVIWYALNTVEKSEVIDDCVLVVSIDDIEYVSAEIVLKYNFKKVDAVIAGGEERYLSVLSALRFIAGDGMGVPDRDGYVFIHDGARPFINEDMLIRLSDAVSTYHACVAAMPSKDTVKLTDADAFAVDTPDRGIVWNVQTPQVFDTGLIVDAYEAMAVDIDGLKERGISITDDAGVVELFTDYRVKMVEGSYKNIKLTTPEDMIIAEAFLRDAGE